MKTLPEINRLARHRRALLLCILAVVIYFAVAFVHPLSWLSEYALETIKHAIGAIAVVLVVHLIDRLYFVEDMDAQFQEIKTQFETTREELVRKTGEQFSETQRKFETAREQLVNASASLQAMTQCGLLRIYPSRDLAAEDIFHDLVDEKVTKIRIIGISLNDFIGAAPNAALHKVWIFLKDLVKNKSQRPLDVKIMIIDPDCLGARLREKGENRNTTPAGFSRLLTDLEHTTAEMKGLLGSPKADGGVSFDCKFYRLPPQMFMCWTDHVCYIQPYHFWSARDQKTSIPIFKYRPIHESSDQAHRMHAEMLEHFDWVWTKGELSFPEREDQFIRGTDAGIIQTAAINCFTDPELAKNRILSLLSGEAREVDIQGVSLHSFFGHETALQRTLLALFERKGVKVRILVLDPKCEQAKYRSYREYLLAANKTGSKLEFPDYCKVASHHTRSQLVVHTESTIDSFKHWVEKQTRSDSQSNETIVNGEIEMRYYTSAPACFILRVDNTILVEQYHYGKVERASTARKESLGRDMPLFEFKRTTQQDFYDQLGTRNPFNLLTNHLDFAWTQAMHIAGVKRNDG